MILLILQVFPFAARTFVTRALLACDSYESVVETLRCKGFGIADAMSVNLTFLKQPSGRLIYNIEVSPDFPLTDESVLNICTIKKGEHHFHTNK